MKKKKQNDGIVWRWPVGSATDQDIAVVEKRLGVSLPIDYVICAKLNQGAHPDRECYDFPGHKQAVFGHLLAITKVATTPTVVGTYERVRDRLLPLVFPFAQDPFGNLICFKYKNHTDEPEIAFWNHELAKSNPIQATIVVRRNFTELIESLYDPTRKQ